jgi:hypothetical protein
MSLSWITDILSGTGHVFGAQWWNNLLDGIPNPVSRPEVLKCIARQANIDAGYLTQRNRARDDRIEAELELIAALRETRSAHSPGSSGGGVDASALRKLTALLRTSAIAPHQPSGDACR